MKYSSVGSFHVFCRSSHWCLELVGCFALVLLLCPVYLKLSSVGSSLVMVLAPLVTFWLFCPRLIMEKAWISVPCCRMCQVLTFSGQLLMVKRLYWLQLYFFCNLLIKKTKQNNSQACLPARTAFFLPFFETTNYFQVYNKSSWGFDTTMCSSTAFTQTEKNLRTFHANNFKKLINFCCMKTAFKCFYSFHIPWAQGT